MVSSLKTQRIRKKQKLRAWLISGTCHMINGGSFEFELGRVGTCLPSKKNLEKGMENLCKDNNSSYAGFGLNNITEISLVDYKSYFKKES